MAEQATGRMVFNPDQCKGCGLCVESCPPKGLRFSTELNRFGIHPAEYVLELCQSCGTCYYFCPELGAITVCCRNSSDYPERQMPAA